MRPVTALFFTFLFTVVLVAPTVISLVDDVQEVSIFVDVNEEEENKEGKESKTNGEIKLFASIQNDTSSLQSIQDLKNIRFRSKIYFSEYANIDTPPPRTTLFA